MVSHFSRMTLPPICSHRGTEAQRKDFLCASVAKSGFAKMFQRYEVGSLVIVNSRN